MPLWYYLPMKIAPNFYSVEPSRYGQHRSVCRVGDNRFIIEGPSKHVRGASDENGPSMADFEGGPCVFTGMDLRMALGDAPCLPEGKTVKSARFLSPQEYAELVNMTDAHWVWVFEKPDYAYCLVETENTSA